MENMGMNKQENGQKFNACETCGCMGHSHGYCSGYGHGYHGHFLLRWLLGLLLLGIVFALGVKIGEFKSGFGDYGHMRYGDYQMMTTRPMMMYGTSGNMMYQTATTTPATQK